MWVLTQVKSLGHVISCKGRVVDPSKIETIMDWYFPSNIHKIWSFLGLARCYWKFLPNDIKLLEPLTALTKTNAKFNWTEKCKQCIQEFKRRLASTPVLASPKPYKSCVVYSDTWKIEFGCVLIQKGRVVVYTSR